MLAMALGMPLRVMLKVMDSRELSMWHAYWQQEPFGPWRDDFRAGTVAAAVFNSQRASATSPILSPDKFIPRFSRQHNKPTDLDRKKQTAILRSMVHGAAAEARIVDRVKGK